MPVEELRRSVRRHPRSAVATGVAAIGAIVAVASKLPGSVVVPGMILLLSAVDIIGALAAKQWAHSPGIWVFLVGSVLYVLLFWLYAQSLRHGDLTTVTVGWVAVLTIASMVLDRYHYGVHFAPVQMGGRGAGRAPARLPSDRFIAEG